MMVFTSSLERTLPSLQAIFRTSRIPYTVLLIYILLHERLTFGRFICTCGILIGVFTSLEPFIFNNYGQCQEKSYAAAVWPLVFGLVFLPSSLANVLQERYIKREAKIIGSNTHLIVIW